MSGRVQDRVIVVTGAAGGQGAAEVAALHAEGAVVIATDVESVAGDVPDRIHPLRLDVTDPADWQALGEWAGETFGRVDGLINNAGTTSRVPLTEVPLEEWNRTLGVNLTGPMLGIQTLAPLMGAGGSIANVGSVAGLTAHYTAGKWGLRGLTRVAALELGPRGIRVNAVHPGYIETPMTASAPAGFRRANEALTPLGRVGMPEEVAALMVFLMSEESSYLSGADIPVDGGFSSCASGKVLFDAVNPRVDSESHRENT
jgi:3alpha(or 20beta)-hydroxysteroid dehydrogenase